LMSTEEFSVLEGEINALYLVLSAFVGIFG
jgi:hypothetical protein